MEDANQQSNEELSKLPSAESFFENIEETIHVQEDEKAAPTEAKAPEQKAEEKQEDQAPERKTITLLDSEGNQVTIPLDQEHKWTTKKGQESKAQLEDLQNDYLGRSYVDKLAKENRESLDLANNLKGGINDLIDLSKDGDPDKLYLAMLDRFKEIDPTFDKEGHLKLVAENLSKTDAMSEEERKLHRDRLDLQSQKRQLERQTKGTKEAADREAMNVAINSITEELNIDREELNTVYQDLLQNEQGFSSKTDAEQLIDIRTEVILSSYIQRAEDIISSVDSSLLDDGEAGNDLVNFLARNTQATDSQLKKRLENLYQTPKHLKKANARAEKAYKATGRTQENIDPSSIPVDEFNLHSDQFKGLDPHEVMEKFFDNNK